MCQNVPLIFIIIPQCGKRAAHNLFKTNGFQWIPKQQSLKIEDSLPIWWMM